jgi:hypothetical protein
MIRTIIRKKYKISDVTLHFVTSVLNDFTARQATFDFGYKIARWSRQMSS